MPPSKKNHGDPEKRRLRHQKRMEYVRSKRDKPCADCGQSFPVICMDFHHEGDKDPFLQSARMGMAARMRYWSIKRIDEELAKCIVLCSNCHRLRHSS